MTLDTRRSICDIVGVGLATDVPKQPATRSAVRGKSLVASTAEPVAKPGHVQRFLFARLGVL